MALGKQLARIFDFAIEIKDSEYDAWTESTNYEIHNFVQNNSTFYYCKQAHVSDDGATLNNEPGAGSDWESYWIDLGNTGFIDIGGINSFSPSREKNDVDTSDFDSQGWMEHMVASRGLSFDLEGFHIENETNGARNPGQYLAEELAMSFGPQAKKDFRLINPSQDNIDFEISADSPFKGTSDGGGTDDASGWSITITMTGQPKINN